MTLNRHPALAGFTLGPQGFNLVSTLGNHIYSAKSDVPEGRCDRSLARSAWDTADPKSRPVGYGMIRAGVRTDWTIG